jgi:hypothetical protein
MKALNVANMSSDKSVDPQACRFNTFKDPNRCFKNILKRIELNFFTCLAVVLICEFFPHATGKGSQNQS